MSARRRLAGWPLPVPLAVGSLLVFLGTLALTMPRWAWPYQEWAGTSSEFHETLLFGGPIAAAAATYYAGRLTPRSRIFGRPGGARTPAYVVRQQLSACLGVLGAAYLLALVPLVVLTVVRADSGGPDLLVIVVSLLGLGALIALGYGVGVVAGSAWPALLTLIVGFLAMQSTGIDHTRFAAVDPVTNFPAVLGRAETVPITFYRGAFFVVVFVCVVAIAIDRLTARGRGWWLSGGSVLLVGVVAVGIAVPRRWQPAILVEQADAPAVCQRVDSLDYCVHQGHRSQLTAMVAESARLLSVYGPAPAALSRMRDRALAGPGDDQYADNTVWVELAPNAPTAQSTADEFAPVLAGESVCNQKFPPVNGEVTPDPMVQAQNLELALAHAVGLDVTGDSTSSLESLSTTALRGWIAAHRTAIEGCSLTADQLP
jgi:hypothetical protein